MIEINFRQLNRDTLDNLLTEIVLREGTDYGAIEQPIEDKKSALLKKLQSGEAVIMYDASENFCDVIQKT